MRKMYDLLLREKNLLKFLIIGGFGMIVNILFLWFFKSIIGLNLEYAGVLAIEVSVISNFILNNAWTFNKVLHEYSLSKRILKYHLSVLSGISTNYGALLTLANVFGVYYLLSNIIGIGLGTITNYLLSSRWVWKEKVNTEKSPRGGSEKKTRDCYPLCSPFSR